MDHTCVSFSSPPGISGVVARCRCGWVSAPVASSGLAGIELDRHRQAVARELGVPVEMESSSPPFGRDWLGRRR